MGQRLRVDRELLREDRRERRSWLLVRDGRAAFARRRLIARPQEDLSDPVLRRAGLRLLLEVWGRGGDGDSKDEGDKHSVGESMSSRVMFFRSISLRPRPKRRRGQ